MKLLLPHHEKTMSVNFLPKVGEGENHLSSDETLRSNVLLRKKR